MGFKLQKYIFLYIQGLLFTHKCFCVKFDPNYFGISFKPYVLEKEKYSRQVFKSYTMKNIETMLEVVSSKFSKVLIKDDYTYRETYRPGNTYKHGSFASIYSGEVAAKINKKRGSKALTVYYELNVAVKLIDVDIPVVFEATEIANRIYPGTVEGIIFARTKTLPHVNQILEYLETYKNKSMELGVKLGAGVISCYDILKGKNVTISKAQEELVKNVDIVTCGNLQPVDPEIGPKDSFLQVGRDLLSFQELLRDMNPNVEVTGNMRWSSNGSETFENVKNLKEYWESANTWASKEKVTLFLDEAFDNPFRNSPPKNAHFGWWKLSSNSLINSIEGYIEKASDQGSEYDETPETWSGFTISLVVVGVLVLIAILSSLFAFLFSRRRKQPKVLSSTEIRLFISGSVKVAGAAKGTDLENALNGPYNKSLEIPKDKLNFDDDVVLGTGEFGCIYKATIEVDGGLKKEVAIKVAKQICASTLKGLLSEIKIMSYLGKHPNIVSLEGAYTAELARGVVYVATELCNLGSLEGYLRKTPLTRSGNDVGNDGSSCISIFEMIQWSRQIASGMEYLESKHVVHADLATRNVLLTSLKIAKITDFGLSRRMYNYMNYVKTHQEPLPWRWMAIESLQKLEFSSKSDVWSYGVTLWEIFSKGNIPYQGLSWTQGFSNDLEDGLRPHCPSLATPDIYKMMQDCWNGEPKCRPSFNELVSRTDTILLNFGEGSNDEEVPRYLNLIDAKKGS